MQPKAHAINHATAIGGRDTVKVLMALLDEEALSPPCLNKADLLSEDQPAVSGGEANSFLALFRLVKIFTLAKSSIKGDWAFGSSAAIS